MNSYAFQTLSTAVSTERCEIVGLCQSMGATPHADGYALLLYNGEDNAYVTVTCHLYGNGSIDWLIPIDEWHLSDYASAAFYFKWYTDSACTLSA